MTEVITEKHPKITKALWEKQVPSEVKEIIAKLESMEAEAYLVGGAVRDLFFGRTPKDYDIATNASENTIERLFPSGKWVGKAFGVYLYNDIEIARFRSDGQYSDSRHPDSVKFVTNIADDLRRRDFTINAIAINSKELVYTATALQNIENGRLNFVGNTEDRIEEDPLRLLRGLRFISQLGVKRCYFTNKQTIDKLKSVSVERIREEFNKLLLGEFVKKAMLESQFALFEEWLGLPEATWLGCVSQGQPTKYHKYTVWNHTMYAVEYADGLVQKLIAFYHDLGKPKSVTYDTTGTPHFYGDKNTPTHAEISAEIADKSMRYLKYSNEMRERVVAAVRNHSKTCFCSPTKRSLRRLRNKLGEQTFKDVMEFAFVDFMATGKYSLKQVVASKTKTDRLLEQIDGDPVDTIDLALDGNDIMSILDIEPGPEVGKVKAYLMGVVIDKPEKNTKEELTRLVEEERKD